MNISNYLEETILNAVFRGQPYISPEAVYIALYTSNPTGTDNGNEVNGDGYVRKPVNFSVPIQVNNKATIENISDVEFDPAESNWGTITHVGLRDAAAEGNLLYYGPVTNPRTINTNDRLKFLAGDLIVDLS